MKTF
jgi:hypothetical protein